MLCTDVTIITILLPLLLVKFVVFLVQGNRDFYISRFTNCKYIKNMFMYRCYYNNDTTTTTLSKICCFFGTG